MLGRISSRTLGIFEKKSAVVAHFAHQGKRFLIIFFRLGVETAKQVGRYSTVRQDTADSGNTVQIPFTRIFTIHHFQDARASRLCRKVDHLTYIIMLGDHVQSFVTHILRVRSGKADTHLRYLLGHTLQQNGKRNFLSLFLKEIRVYILP